MRADRQDRGRRGVTVTATVTTITIGKRFSVNCYLVSTDAGFVMVDSGMASGRDAVRDALAEAGCARGGLKLVAITHGDSDHIGNALWLREEYGAPIGMSEEDTPMATSGDMFASRKGASPITRSAIRAMTSVLGVGLHARDRFTPDLALREGRSLAEWGFDATVLAFPGHSAGSIGVLTSEGDFFSGDLLANSGDAPAVGPIVDDEPAMSASVRRLRDLPIISVYPGHGKPFPIASFEWPAPAVAVPEGGSA